MQFPLCYQLLQNQMINRLPQLKTMCNLQQQLQAANSQQLVGSNAYMNENLVEGINDQFFEEVKSIRELIQILKINNGRIQNIKAKYSKAIKSAQEKANSDQMGEILIQNGGIYEKLKGKLQYVQQKVKEAEEVEPDEPQTKMKKNFFYSISKEASQVLKQQQSYEDQYKTTVKQKITRQVRLIDRDIGEEQLQQYIENPDLAQEMLQKKIYGQASVTLKNTVSDIQDKFRDIQKLQRAVLKCLDLFKQLSALVVAQGERIDSIQQNVAGAKDYVGKAQIKLKQAKQHHKCSKKCMCCLIVIFLIVLIVVVIVVVATKK